MLANRTGIKYQVLIHSTLPQFKCLRHPCQKLLPTPLSDFGKPINTNYTNTSAVWISATVWSFRLKSVAASPINRLLFMLWDIVRLCSKCFQFSMHMKTIIVYDVFYPTISNIIRVKQYPRKTCTVNCFRRDNWSSSVGCSTRRREGINRDGAKRE